MVNAWAVRYRPKVPSGVSPPQSGAYIALVHLDGQPAGPIRLTLLDERNLFRDCLARLLESAGFAVVSHHPTAHAFLNALELERPQVALLHLDEGGGENLTVLEEAHQLHPKIRLLVLACALTSDAMDRCFKAGAAGYLDVSTARVEALVDAVNAVARGNNVFPAEAVESLLRAPARRGHSADLLRNLSEREREVLGYLSVGADNLQIAELLSISERTVKAHVSNLYRKLGQDNRTQLALLARRSGLRAPGPFSPDRGSQAGDAG